MPDISDFFLFHRDFFFRFVLPVAVCWRCISANARWLFGKLSHLVLLFFFFILKATLCLHSFSINSNSMYRERNVARKYRSKSQRHSRSNLRERAVHRTQQNIILYDGGGCADTQSHCFSLQNIFYHHIGKSLPLYTFTDKLV